MLQHAGRERLDAGGGFARCPLVLLFNPAVLPVKVKASFTPVSGVPLQLRASLQLLFAESISAVPGPGAEYRG